MYEYVNYNIAPHSDELYHYGVKGMKWGVRRATKAVSRAEYRDELNDAIGSLQKHRSKASAKIAKLEKKRPQLEKDVQRHITKNDERVADLRAKSARLQNKAYGRFTSKDKSDKLLFKAGKLDAKANTMAAQSAKAKAKLAKNEALQNAFKQGVKDIDAAIAEAGKKKVSDIMDTCNGLAKWNHDKNDWELVDKTPERRLTIEGMKWGVRRYQNADGSAKGIPRKSDRYPYGS